jgi:hypothetical protein
MSLYSVKKWTLPAPDVGSEDYGHDINRLVLLETRLSGKPEEVNQGLA